MATNLLISYPGIEYTASIQAHSTEDSNHPAENAVRAPRSTYFRPSSEGFSSSIDFDLETGNSETPDHLIFCRFNKITQMDTADPTLTAYGDDNSSFSSAQQFSAFNITDASLIGPDGEDHIHTFSPSQAERYWRIRIDTTTAEKHEWTYVRLGTFLDMGRDPIYGAELSFDQVTINERRPAYKISLTWKGVTDAKVQSFLSNVVEFSERLPVFLYDQNDYLLNNKTLLPCFVENHSVTPTHVNSNTVSATFREFI